MNLQRRVRRRRFLAITGAGIGASLASPRLVFAQNTHPIKFTLPWVAEGSTLYTFVAKGMGLWEKRGLDVDIARGSGSVASAQAIGDGRVDFGLSTPSIPLLQAINGLPIPSLPRCSHHAPLGLVLHDRRPNKGAQDHERRTNASVH